MFFFHKITNITFLIKHSLSNLTFLVFLLLFLRFCFSKLLVLFFHTLLPLFFKCTLYSKSTRRLSSQEMSLVNFESYPVPKKKYYIFNYIIKTQNMNAICWYIFLYSKNVIFFIKLLEYGCYFLQIFIKVLIKDNDIKLQIELNELVFF